MCWLCLRRRVRRNPLVQLIPFALVLAIFYFIILLPMKRRQKKVQEFLSALKVGDRVITSGGIYGSITKVNEQSVQLQVAQNVRLEVARSAIVGYQGQEPVVDAAERVIEHGEEPALEASRHRRRHRAVGLCVLSARSRRCGWVSTSRAACIW